MSNRGAGGRKGKTMQPSEKINKRPGAEARTKKNKARRVEKREAMLQKVRDRLREGMTVKVWKQHLRDTGKA